MMSADAFWQLFVYLFGAGLMTGIFVTTVIAWVLSPAKAPKAAPQSEQVPVQLAIEDEPTHPMPAIKLWPFSDFMLYQTEVHGTCVFCGGTLQKKGASLQ